MNRSEFSEESTFDEWGRRIETRYTMDEMRRMIDSSHIPDELKQPLAIGLAFRAVSRDFEAISKESLKGVFGRTHWAIRKDSLRLVEIIAGTALAIATFATVVGSSPVTFAVTLVIAALTLEERLRNKGAYLKDYQYDILVILKAVGPTTAKQVAEHLSGLHIHGPNVWTEERAYDALVILKAVHLGDGSIEALVTQAANGLWAANGI